MSDDKTAAQPMGWGKIILIMLGVGLSVGFVLGGPPSLLGWSGNLTPSGVGASMGVTGGILFGRRQALLKAAQPSRDSEK